VSAQDKRVEHAFSHFYPEKAAQGQKVEQAFRPAMKLPKTSLALAAEVQIARSVNLDGNTAVAEADLCNALTAGLKACSTL